MKTKFVSGAFRAFKSRRFSLCCKIFAVGLIGLSSSCYTGQLRRPSGNIGQLKQSERNFPINSEMVKVPRYSYTVDYVEFDGKGNYLEERQAIETIRHLRHLADRAQARGKRLVVISFTHGWRHGSASANVLQFRKLIKHCATSLGQKNLDVAGVYLSWPGAPFGDLPKISSSDQYEIKGTAISNFELLSYMNRKAVAAKISEGKSDFTQFIDDLSINFSKHRNPASRHIAIGHSLGGFILENALISPYVIDPVSRERATPDLVFTMNSAAPASLSQKIVSQYRPAVPEIVNKVRFVSITSSADGVTKDWAKIGNSISDIFYQGNIPNKSRRNLTPGHDDSLLTSVIKPVVRDGQQLSSHDDASNEFLIQMNLFPSHEPRNITRRPLRNEIAAFDKVVEAGAARRKFRIWEIVDIVPRPWLGGRYVVLRTDESLIADHGDIWAGQAVSLFCYYAREALFAGPTLPVRDGSEVQER